MFNLAPLRYAKILGDQSGPIARIEYGRVQILGQAYYQASAYLDAGLGLRKAPLQLYSNADGSGTHRSPMLARYIAISEAIERWALYFLYGTRQAATYGFDVDSSSNGMSAYPGFTWQARRKALAEAAERAAMVNWWCGKLPARQIANPGLPVQAIEIANPASRDRVVVLWKLADRGYYAYGFASDRKIRDACWKAYVEMERSVTVLDRFYEENPGFETGDLPIINNFQERRVLYFSLPEGHRKFKERLNASPDIPVPGKVKALVDREVEGPWQKYATVWRVVLPMPTHAYLDHGVDDFFFW
jgi:hypothetical protein